jgi:hypothetical protein
MSYRKTRLIQERNILLERKYILEQAPPPPPAGGAPSSGSTTSAPAPPATTTTTTKKTNIKLNELPNCSDIGILSKPDNPVEVTIDGKKYMKDPKGNGNPYCKV